MKNRVIMFLALLIASVTFTSFNTLQMLSPQAIPDFDQYDNSFLLNGKKIKVQALQDFDGLRLILDGKGQSLDFDSFDLIEDLFIQKTIKSISIINSPASNITVGQIINVSLILENDPYSTIANNSIGNFTDSTYTCGIKLVDSPHTEIYNNTIFNISSTSNSASGIHLVNSQNTTIRNNTIQRISSNSTGLFESRDTCGILINSSQEVKIFDTIIEDLDDGHGFGFGILVESSPRIEINDSHIDHINSSSSLGISIKNSQTAIVYNNTIAGLTSSSQVLSGISLQDSSDSLIILNNISTISGDNLVNGVYFDNSGNSIVGNNTIQALNSTFTSNPLNNIGLYGINLKASESTTVNWNKISLLNSPSSEGIGIFAEDSRDLLARNNTISNVTSSFGIYIISSDETTLIMNEFSNVQNWLYIDETSHDVVYSFNIVNGLVTTLEAFARPADLIIEEGDTTNSISWVASTDPFLAANSYNIYKDGELIENGTWQGGASVNHPLDYNLTVGTYYYQIIFTEDNGLNTTDDVIVAVIETNQPQLTDTPDDIHYLAGAPGQELSWTLTDDYPYTYTIYRNGLEIELLNNSWTSSVPIDVTISDLPYGTHNYTLVAYDMSGNSVKDTAFVFVFITIEIEKNMPSLMRYEYENIGKTLNLNWTVYSAESGTFSIFQDNGTIKAEIASGAFTPAEPILHHINVDDLPIGTYNYTIVVNDYIEDYVLVIIIANPDIQAEYGGANKTIPQHSIPPYLTRPGADPLPGILTGGFMILATCAAGYWYVTRHLTVPSSVKDEKKAIKKARKAKNIHEEGKRLGAIGRIYFKAGNFKKAIKSHEEALSIFKKTGDKDLQIKELESLGNAHLVQGVEET